MDYICTPLVVLAGSVPNAIILPDVLSEPLFVLRKGEVRALLRSLVLSLPLLALALSILLSKYSAAYPWLKGKGG